MQPNSLQAKWSNFLAGEYTAAEWLCIKISVMLFIGPGLIHPLFNRVNVPLPSGLCELLNCGFALQPYMRWIIAALITSGLLAFLFEKKMVYSTLLLFIASLLIYSIQESQGHLRRSGILSLIFLAQFAAYSLHRLGVSANLSRNRVQFTAQFIAGAYLLAALSKITTSGWAWFTDSPNVALQVIKSFDYGYFDSANYQLLQTGQKTATWISNHTTLVKLLFGSALLLELGSFMLLCKKQIAFVYALLLLCMHLGILWVMDIFFPTISFPLIIFLINPLYILYLCAWSITKLISNKNHTAAT